tara:strand:+ start:373 stop:603 length:231 start_codon:yes stop_codon:yes gene_type:complete
MRQIIINSLISHARGKIDKHKANVEVYLRNPVGIGEHSDVMEAIEGEIDMIAKYKEQIDMIEQYFINDKTVTHEGE